MGYTDDSDRRVNDLARDEIHIWIVHLDRAVRGFHDASVEGSTTSPSEPRAASNEPHDAPRNPELVLPPELNPAERDQAGRFRTPDLRRRYVAAHVALRRILSGYVGRRAGEISFSFDGLGKPRLKEGELRDGRSIEFNLAHSGELAIVAVTSGTEIGVDVEQHRSVRRLEGLARRYFHRDEIAVVLAGDDDQARQPPFFHCWTRKEAILKAIGIGVQYPLESFAVPLDPAIAQWVEVPSWRSTPATRLWLRSLDAPAGYFAAVACTEERSTVRSLQFIRT